MSREGRDLQRWGEDGSRLCSGCVPLVNGRVALITNRSDMTKWGLPKGGWELDEPYAATAAERESYEEAGVKGIIGAELHQKAEYMAKSKKMRFVSDGSCCTSLICLRSGRRARSGGVVS